MSAEVETVLSVYRQYKNVGDGMVGKRDLINVLIDISGLTEESTNKMLSSYGSADAEKLEIEEFVSWLFQVASTKKMEGASMADSSGESESDQLAKCMANIERLRSELNANPAERNAIGYPEVNDARRAEIAVEMKSRKAKCKELIAKGVVPSPTICVFNQIDMHKTRRLSGKAISRLVRGMTNALGKKFEVESEDEIMKTLDADNSGDIDIKEWCEKLPLLPKLYAALKEDLDPEWGVLTSFRTPADQIAKCMGNIERLRRELQANQDERKALGLPTLTEERKTEIGKEMAQRKKQCKQYRALGIEPSPSYCVFNQMDVMKTRKLDAGTLNRMVKGLRKALGEKYPIEDFDKIMEVLDKDKSGDIDESEWVQHVKKLPKLYKAMEADLDKDYGVLQSFRSPEDQLAKCMGAIQRLKRELNANQAERTALGLPPLTDERKAKIEEELRSRKNHCKKWRAMGITPSPGYCVFNQVDADHSKKLSHDKMERVLKSVITTYGSKYEIEDLDYIMNIMDEDRSGDISEHEWMVNLEKCPKLYKALEADVDPDYGVLSCFRTPEDQLAKCMGNIQRLKRELDANQDERKALGLPEVTEERKAKIQAEILSRKDLCKKFRAQGIRPSPGYCVFSQIDVDKKRVLSRAKLERVLKAITSAMGSNYEIESLEVIMNTLDKDHSGDISEHEWCLNLKECPNFYNALQEDVDPDYGVLNSFRTPEDQLAKCMGNLARLKAELDAGAADERKVAIEAEMVTRKELCKKFRAQGVKPSPGVCVFNQLDTEKKRSLTKEKISALVTALKGSLGTEIEDIDTIMNGLDKGNTGSVTEHGWVLNLKQCPLLLKALEADIDPDYGILRCIPGDKMQF